jgi:O-antigen/teichoic acid export membrane protein
MTVGTALTGQLILACSGIILARALGVEGRGQLAAVILVPALVSQIGVLGVPLALTFYTARDEQYGADLLRSLAWVIASQVAALTLLQAVLFLAIVEGDEWTAARAVIPVIPALIAQQYGLAVLQGCQRFLAFNALRIAPAALFAFFAGLLLMFDSATVIDVVIAWVVANVLVAVPLLVISVRFAAGGRTSVARTGVRDAVAYGARAFVGSSSPSEVIRVDQLVVALVVSRAALGLYVVALAFVNLPRFVSQSVGMVAYPRLASAATGERARLARSYVLLAVLVAAVVAATLEAVVPRLVPALFGSGFSAATDTTRILLVAALLLAVRRVLTDVSQGIGRPGAGSIAEVIYLAVAVPLVAAGAQQLGIEGAAVGVALGAAASLAFLSVSVRRTLRRQSSAAADVPPGQRVLALDQGVGP